MSNLHVCTLLYFYSCSEWSSPKQPKTQKSFLSTFSWMAISPCHFAKQRIWLFLCLSVHMHSVSNFGFDIFFNQAFLLLFIMFITWNTLSTFIYGWSFTVWVCNISGGGQVCCQDMWPCRGTHTGAVCSWRTDSEEGILAGAVCEHCSPREGLTLENFMKDCLWWQGPHAGAGQHLWRVLSMRGKSRRGNVSWTDHSPHFPTPCPTCREEGENLGVKLSLGRKGGWRGKGGV